MLRLLLIIIPVAVTIYALIDVIATPGDRVRTLPKWLWILLVVLLWIGGAVLWFFLGRPSRQAQEPGGRTVAPSGPDDDPDFIDKLRREQRRNKPTTES